MKFEVRNPKINIEVQISKSPAKAGSRECQNAPLTSIRVDPDLPSIGDRFEICPQAGGEDKGEGE
ncbi:MAG: hypothetical protein A2170_08210 [Deltaproteobacteria bacterium RBG_13_53_10]|nr:MAG: hypothetical protein A2170_08210 [Deltaproteobacteria bacterium RBG_13_53_10]